MNEAARENARPKKRRRGSPKRIAPPAGDVTFISVPKPPAAAFNKERPIGCLIQAQLLHGFEYSHKTKHAYTVSNKSRGVFA